MSTIFSRSRVQSEPGAKLYFYATGTSTPQDTYQDADLTTPHANPVVADAEGYFDPIFLDPAGGDYRYTLTDTNDVALEGPIDDVPASGIGFAVGSFTATLTGMSGSTTGTVYYQKIGSLVHMWAPSNIIGTSNSTAMTMTGIPTGLQPSVGGVEAMMARLTNNSGTIQGYATISGGTMSFLVWASTSSASYVGFNNSGNKGLQAGWTCVYTVG